MSEWFQSQLLSDCVKTNATIASCHQRLRTNRRAVRRSPDVYSRYRRFIINTVQPEKNPPLHISWYFGFKSNTSLSPLTPSAVVKSCRATAPPVGRGVCASRSASLCKKRQRLRLMSSPPPEIIWHTQFNSKKPDWLVKIISQKESRGFCQPCGSGAFKSCISDSNTVCMTSWARRVELVKQLCLWEHSEAMWRLTAACSRCFVYECDRRQRSQPLTSQIWNSLLPRHLTTLLASLLQLLFEKRRIGSDRMGQRGVFYRMCRILI